MRPALSVSILLLSTAIQADPQPGNCTEPSDQQQLFECRAKLQAEKSKVLDVLFAAALKRLPESGELDSRKARQQLVLAQKAWRDYVDKNCDFIGGQQGGSNPWVSYFAAECVIEETQKRIDFFKNSLGSPY